MMRFAPIDEMIAPNSASPLARSLRNAVISTRTDRSPQPTIARMKPTHMKAALIRPLRSVTGPRWPMMIAKAPSTASLR